MGKFWLCLCRFAYRRAAQASKVPPDGIPMMRDPDHPCSGYEPRTKKWQDWGRCRGDGHYLCNECCHHERAEEEIVTLNI